MAWTPPTKDPQEHVSAGAWARSVHTTHTQGLTRVPPHGLALIRLGLRASSWGPRWQRLQPAEAIARVRASLTASCATTTQCAPPPRVSLESGQPEGEGPPGTTVGSLSPGSTSLGRCSPAARARSAVWRGRIKASFSVSPVFSQGWFPGQRAGGGHLRPQWHLTPPRCPQEVASHGTSHPQIRALRG